MEFVRERAVIRNLCIWCRPCVFKTLAIYVDLKPDTCKDKRGAIELGGFEAEHKLCTGTGTGVLGEDEEHGAGALGAGAEAEPGGQWDAPGELGRGTAEIEHNGRETATGEQKIGRAQSLVEGLPDW